MKEYVLKYSGEITAFVFYRNILQEVNHIFDNPVKGAIVLDFSDVYKIESPVVPNLLILGNYIEERTGIKPCIYITESVTSGALKKYLYAIKFFSLCEDRERYFLDLDKYTGWPQKNMEGLNTSVFFKEASKEELSEEQRCLNYPLITKRIWNTIYDNLKKFADTYLTFYQEFVPVKDERESMKYNMALSVIHEIVKNSLIHGRSYSYVTFQTDYSRRKIYISISDFGKGFLRTLREKDIQSADEGEAIVKGVFLRAGEMGYGLFDTIGRTLEHSGIVRIHSNTTQIILTHRKNNDKTNNSFLSYLKKRDFNNLMKKLRDNENYNYRDGLLLPGVHVEIVLSF